MREWTGLEFSKSQRAVESRGKWQKLVAKSSVVKGLMMMMMMNDLVLANTFGHHKASRRWTWHSPYRWHHNLTDYILVMKRFRSGVNSARTRSFSAVDIGNDYGLQMMTFHLRLKRMSKTKYTRFKFDLVKNECLVFFFITLVDES